MKTQDVIDLALASGLYQDDEMFFSPTTGDADVHISDLEYFAKTVAAKEREACAKLCRLLGSEVCHDAIKARGDMFTKSQNVDTSEERVHKSDKSIHDEDDIQEYKKLWVGLTDEERCTFVALLNKKTVNEVFKAIEAALKEKNT